MWPWPRSTQRPDHRVRETGWTTLLSMARCRRSIRVTGIGGSATNGRPAKSLPPSRPVKGFQYPILEAADGRVPALPARRAPVARHVQDDGRAARDSPIRSIRTSWSASRTRTCSPRLPASSPTRPAPRSSSSGRRTASPSPACSRSPIASPPITSASAACSWQAELPGGKHAPFPDGVIVLGGQRMGPLQDQPRTAPVWPAPKAAAKPALPLAGLKVLDLGVIVVGAETARLLGDLGAEVIKIESQAFPDGSRQTYLKDRAFGRFRRRTPRISAALASISNPMKARRCSAA